MKVQATLAVMVMLGVPATAGAQEARAVLSLGAAGPAGERPPEILATVDGGPPVPALDRITLGADGASVSAVEVKRYVDGDETLGVAIVFEAQHLWIGNADWIMASDTPDPRNASEGYYKPLAAALPALVAAGPPGSQAVVISYSDDGAVRWFGPLNQLDGAALGSQRELGSEIDGSGQLTSRFGQEVGAGARLALAELRKLGTARKVLIVIGDGRNHDQLTALGDALAGDRIELFTLHLTTEALGHEGIGDRPGGTRRAIAAPG